MPVVFVAYGGQIRPTVARIVEALRADGVDATWDEDLIGGNTDSQIRRKIDQADHVMAILGPSWNGSDWLQGEMQFSRHKLVPVSIEALPPEQFPLLVGGMNVLSLTSFLNSGDRSQFDKLLATFRVAPTARSARPTTHAPQALPSAQAGFSMSISSQSIGNAAGVNNGTMDASPTDRTK